MSAAIEDDETLLFMLCSKSTQYASRPRLQTFIDSLTTRELKHLIEIYLNHTIVSRRKYKNAAAMSNIQQAKQQILNNDAASNELNSTDQSILKKMNDKYARAHEKKVVKEMQQKHASHTHLLSISSHTLAYCFQFLTFRELCRAQSTCSYFKYLHATYLGSCHHYIRLDAAFFQKTMRCKVDLRFLRQFKYIDLKCLYYGRSLRLWDPSIARRTAFFQYILQRVIKQSQSCLQTLKIDVEEGFGNTQHLHQYSGLSLIMNAVDTLPITQLIWMKDLFSNRRQQVAHVIQENLLTKFPNIQHVTFGDSVSALSMAMYPSVGFHNLRSLCLECLIQNLFAERVNLLQRVSSIASLTKLDISCVVLNEELANVEPCAIVNTTLKELTLSLARRCSWPDTTSEAAAEQHTSILCSQRIVQQCFSIFSGLVRFSHLKTRCLDDIPISDWKEPLRTLARAKRVQSLTRQVQPLESLELRMTGAEAGSFLYFLNDPTVRNDAFLNLRHFALAIDGERHMFDLVLLHHLVALMQNTNSLLSLQLFVTWDLKWNVQSHMLSVSHLLSNLPNSLQHFSLITRWINHTATKTKYYNEPSNENESQHLIQKLYELSVDPHSLCSITLPVWLIHPSHRNYMNFYFGYQNKLEKSNTGFPMHSWWYKAHDCGYVIRFS